MKTARPAPALPRPLGRLGLTTREQQMLFLLLAGASLSAAAEQLGLSVDTCKGYTRALYGKLAVRNRQGITAAVIERLAPGVSLWDLIEAHQCQ